MGRSEGDWVPPAAACSLVLSMADKPGQEAFVGKSSGGQNRLLLLKEPSLSPLLLVRWDGTPVWWVSPLESTLSVRNWCCLYRQPDSRTAGQPQGSGAAALAQGARRWQCDGQASMFHEVPHWRRLPACFS